MSTSEPLVFLRWLGLLVAAATCALLGHVAFKDPPLSPVTLGEKGRQRQRWISQSGSNHFFDSLLRWAGRWVEVVVHRETLARIEHAVVLAGHPLGLRASEWLAACALSSLASALVVWLVTLQVSLGAWPWAGVVLATVLPWHSVRAARASRVLALERSLPVAMDLVALCVRAGSDFPGALRFVVAELSGAHAVCRHELSQVLEALALGRTREHALRGLAARVDSPAVRDLVAALVQSELRGIPLGESLSSQAQSLRRARSVRAEELAAKAGVRMVIPLMLMLCSILLLLLGPMVIEGMEL